jgi:hypothetical protein
VRSQAVSQPAHVRSQQGGPQELCVKVQPYIAVIPGAQVEVPSVGMSKLGHAGIHHVMLAVHSGRRKPRANVSARALLRWARGRRIVELLQGSHGEYRGLLTVPAEPWAGRPLGDYSA